MYGHFKESQLVHCDFKEIYNGDDFQIFINKPITSTIDGNRVKPDNSSQASIIISAYKKDTQNTGLELDGNFSFIIYDKSEKKISIHNNRYQATKFYYASSNGSFYFSDRPYEIAKIIGPKVDIGAMKAFVSNGFTIPDQTQFEGIKKLLPTFSAHFDGKELYLTNYWDKQFSINRRKSLDNLDKSLDFYENIYRDGIDEFIDSYGREKEVGTLLSGGHDTSFVALQSSRVLNKKLHCYTSTFPGWAFDEGEYAENIAKKVNGIYHSVPFLPNDLDLIVSLIQANQEPVVGSSLPLHKIALTASKDVGLMLAGDGGDTLWGEYYPVEEFHRYIKNCPRSIRKFIHQCSKVLVKLTDWERFWELEHVASLFTEDDYYSHFMTNLCTYRHYTKEFRDKLFVPEINNVDIPKPILEIEFNRENFGDSLIEGKLFNAFYTYQSFHTTKSMEHFGLEFYMPTIKKNVIDFICSLPANYINGGTTFHRLTNNKTINRRFHKLALSRHLKTEEIYNRSFDIPWYNILKPREQMLEKLRQRLIKRGWFQKEMIDKIFSEFLRQDAKDYELLELKHHGYRIFTLLSLEIWAIEFIDGRNTQDADKGVNLEEYLS